MNKISFVKNTGKVAVGLGVLTYGLGISQYGDVAGFSEDYQLGRTKNSIASVVTGLIAHELYDNSQITMNVKKTCWFDSEITGYTTPTTIQTDSDLTFTSVHFTGSHNGDGMLEGEVDKSEFDWKVKQTGSGTYEVARFGPKFDASINLTLKDGIISGTYERSGPHFDWNIKGTYDSSGNVNYSITGPLTLGLELDGSIVGK